MLIAKSAQIAMLQEENARLKAFNKYEEIERVQNLAREETENVRKLLSAEADAARAKAAADVDAVRTAAAADIDAIRWDCLSDCLPTWIALNSWSAVLTLIGLKRQNALSSPLSIMMYLQEHASDLYNLSSCGLTQLYVLSHSIPFYKDSSQEANG